MHRRENGTKSLEKWVKTLKELTSRKKDIDLADDQDHLLIGGELVPGDGGRGVGVSQAGEGDHLFYIGGDGNVNELFLHDCLHHPNC